MERIDARGLWSVKRPVVGMVHLLPLPGSPGWRGSMAEVEERALTDARALVAGGVDGVLVENYGDVPFFPGPVPPVTVAAMARLCSAVRAAVAVPVGVNVLRNDALAAVSLAATCGATFVRVNVHTGAMLTDQGWIEGRAHETLRERARLGADCAIFADIAVKHAVVPEDFDLAGAARDAWHRGLADALIVTGPATGIEPDVGRIRLVREAVPGAPVWLGSGVTPANAALLAGEVDGVIAGSALQRGGVAGGGVDTDRVAALMAAVRRVD